jgi:hypothetical protein
VSASQAAGSSGMSAAMRTGASLRHDHGVAAHPCHPSRRTGIGPVLVLTHH